MIKSINRPFQISCGLREGYGESSLTHTYEEARNIIQQWIVKRLTEKKPVAVGTLLVGEFIYPLIENDVISSTFEPAFHYKGRIREDSSDEQAVEMLSDLAVTFANTLKQKRVHVEFSNEYWVVES